MIDGTRFTGAVAIVGMIALGDPRVYLQDSGVGHLTKPEPSQATHISVVVWARHSDTANLQCQPSSGVKAPATQAGAGLKPAPSDTLLPEEAVESLECPLFVRTRTSIDARGQSDSFPGMRNCGA